MTPGNPERSIGLIFHSDELESLTTSILYLDEVREFACRLRLTRLHFTTLILYLIRERRLQQRFVLSHVPRYFGSKHGRLGHNNLGSRWREGRCKYILRARSNWLSGGWNVWRPHVRTVPLMLSCDVCLYKFESNIYLLEPPALIFNLIILSHNLHFYHYFTQKYPSLISPNFIPENRR